MSLSAMTWAVAAPINKPTAKLALVCLADHADEDGVCFPSQKALAAKVGVTDRALRDALTWLEDEGYVIRSRRDRKDGSRTSDAYQLPEEAYRKNFPTPRKETQGLPENSSDLTTFEPVTESPTVAAAPVQKLEVLMKQLLEAAGLSDFRAERHIGLLNLAPILGLIDANFDLERDILPVIRAKCATGFKPRYWAYFVDPVREAADQRRGIAAVKKPEAKVIDWVVWCTDYFNGATWPHGLGPEPGEPGCKAPADVVAQSRKAAA